MSRERREENLKLFRRGNLRSEGEEVVGHLGEHKMLVSLRKGESVQRRSTGGWIVAGFALALALVLALVVLLVLAVLALF